MTLEGFLIISAILFCIGLTGVVIKSNIIAILTTPAQKIMSILLAPGSKIAILARAKGNKT